MNNSEYILTGSVANYLDLPGQNLLDRLQGLTDWLNACYEHGVDPYCKSSDGPILAECKAKDRQGRSFQGVNMASQDYLALAGHPAIKEAAKEAIDRYGVHSA